MKKYDHKKIENKWQKEWAAKKIYKTDDSSEKPKFYILDMFPYPSGEGLHVGHPKGFIATDVVSRMKRMQGMNVLHPMGFDAFGLPAENYALKTKTNPVVAVAKNVARYRKQLEIIGFDYDWSREVNTTDPKFYKWTQWIFLKLLEKGMAYESYEPINWCPNCKTGLANEDVEDGKCERCGTPVEKKPMRQWVLRITKYADRLLKDLDAVTGIPMVTREKGEDAFRPNEPVSERWPVVCIIKHWSEDKYLCAEWKATKWNGFVIGGIEKGETPADAALREIREETGYKNAKFIREVGKVDARFFQKVKKHNRLAHFTGVYVELVNGEREEISQEEKDLQDLVWLSPKEVEKFLNYEDMIYLWDLYTGKKKQEIKPLLDWPESIKEAQRNWIGRSEGAEISFEIKGSKHLNRVEVFTTRPDTLFGVTYVVLAPEHELVTELLKDKNDIKNREEVIKYVAHAREMTQIERTDATKDKTGVKLDGITATNPANGEEVPVYVADYVLADYGTGAVMAVPAHDERDFAFAKKFSLKNINVIALNGQKNSHDEAYTGTGILKNSGKFDGMNSEEAKKKITESVGGKWVVKYKLKDWVFSRQRYWGEPIPVLHDDGKIVPVAEKDLPVELPKVKHYEPTGTGESPLAGIPKWVDVKIGTGKNAKIVKRETNTMPQWAGSSWYYLRYMDPKNGKTMVDPKKEKYWNQVDFYVGGAEHATRHLIYARFWHKFLYDIGAVSTIEPFHRLQSVGLIIASDGRKMSKRFGNVVNPDDIIATYGADTMRVYEMFMGPFDQAIAWDTKGLIGPRRFLERVWNLREKISKDAKLPKSVDALLHKTVKKVSDDMADLRHNTAVSSLMILSNELEKQTAIPRDSYETFLKLLAPLAPHITEEIWNMLGNKKSIHISGWPVADESKLADEEVTIVVQVNGKVRASFTATKGTSKEALETGARSLDEVKKWIGNKPIIKTIVVPDKLVSFVVKA